MPDIPILTYHFVGDHPRQREHRSIFCHAPVFSAHMRLLHALGWKTLPLPEIASLSASGSPLPPRRFGLTFDDGDADLWWSVRPVLPRLGFTASVFVVTGAIGGRNDWENAPGLRNRSLLDAEQLRAMADDGWDVGGHTQHHRELTGLAGRELDDEVGGCRRTLEALLGRAPASFCYPSGSVDEQARAAVSAAGFTAATTTRRGRVRAGTDPLQLPRVSVSHRTGPLGLLWRVARAR